MAQVQWDESSNCNGPERVSPWEIEPSDGSAPTVNVPLQSSARNKRPRETTENLDLPSQGMELQTSHCLRHRQIVNYSVHDVLNPFGLICRTSSRVLAVWDATAA
jgi:hypothetical protein